MPPFRRTPLRNRWGTSLIVILFALLAGCSPAGTSNESGAAPAAAGIARTAAQERGSAADSDRSVGGADSNDADEAKAAAPVGLSRVSEDESVLAVIDEHPDLTRFAALVAEHPQRNVFTQARGITVLAPSDAAFDAGLVDHDALAANPDAFTLFLSHHMTVGTFDLASLETAGGFTNAMAQTLAVTPSGDGSRPMVDGSTVIRADLEADNGYVHIIDGPLPINLS